MPKRIHRAAGYGWSYTYAKGQRTKDAHFRDKMDKIKFDNEALTEENGWEDGKNGTFGNCKRKVFK